MPPERRNLARLSRRRANALERPMSSLDDPLMVVTTTTIQGHPIHEYHGIVSAEAEIRYVNRSQRLPATSLRNRRRAGTIERIVHEASALAIANMAQRARQLGATAIIAAHIDYANIQMPGDAALLIITVSGTAVTIS